MNDQDYSLDNQNVIGWEENTKAYNEYPSVDITCEDGEKTFHSISQSSNKPMYIAICMLLTMLLGLCVYVAVILTKTVPNWNVKKDSVYQSQSDDPWSEILGHDDASDDNPKTGNTLGDIFADKSWKEPYPNHAKEEFTGPYYEEFVDCIDETVPYHVQREFVSVEKEKENICIRVSYVQLEGEIPNLEQINKVLKEKALEEYNQYQISGGQNAQLGSIDVKSIVTYNDFDTISVVLMKEAYLAYQNMLQVETVNVNLATGIVMDNESILHLDDSFGEVFRNRSNKQNGSSYGIELYSNEEIVELLRDPKSLILFYTPIGMEVGYHYKRDGYAGWITISLTDYQQFLNGL